MVRGWMHVMLLCSAGVRAEMPPLDCPAGTESRIEPSEDTGAQQQVCVDPKTSMKEGPLRVWHANGKVAVEGQHLHDKMHGRTRVFDPEGGLMVEMVFDQGEQKSGRVTASGLRTMLGNLQTRASMYSMVTEVSIPQDWTIRYDVKSIAALLPPDLQAKEAEENRKMACEIFGSPFDNDFVVELRHVGGGGKVIREEKLTREDCAQRP